MEKKRKPFNAKLFYRRTCLIIYDIISVVIASYMAILWRYDFHLVAMMRGLCSSLGTSVLGADSQG